MSRPEDPGRSASDPAAGSDPVGRVYLIGAGPGDPGLLTLRGAECLSLCDVVLYDGLSNREILTHAAGANCISVGKHGGDRIWKQDEIVAEILHHARAGKIVGRLKGGDPAVFARSAEEIDACVQAGIEFELVPGITAALAAGSYAGIPITHRGLASAVALVTGHEQPGKPESAIDWPALAKFPGTLVVYMGVTTARAWTSSLIGAGKDPATPTALVRRCSHADQQQIHCRLDEVADRLTPASKFRPPVITIIGEVTRLADTMHWLGRRPLFGQTVLVTRPAAKSDDLTRRLRSAGAAVITAPAIEITPVADPSSIDRCIDALADFDAVVFSSDAGVDHFLGRLMLRHDVRRLAGKTIGAVGGKTAAALRRYGVVADRVPTVSNAESFVDQFGGSMSRQSVLVVTASRGRTVMTDGLAAAGARVQTLVAYDHRDVETLPDGVIAAIDAGEVDWVTITSSATAENLVRLLGHRIDRLNVASLSPVTSDALRGLGVEVDLTATDASFESLTQSLIDHAEN